MSRTEVHTQGSGASLVPKGKVKNKFCDSKQMSDTPVCRLGFACLGCAADFLNLLVNVEAELIPHRHLAHLDDFEIVADKQF